MVATEPFSNLSVSAVDGPVVGLAGWRYAWSRAR